MSCVGCNDGCFDESVQLAQGPKGDTGTPGTDGSTTVNAGTDILNFERSRNNISQIRL